MKKLSFYTSIALFLLPLISLPFILFGFEMPKVLLFEFVVVGIFIAQLFFDTLRISKQTVLVFCLFFLLSIVSVLFHPSETLWFGNPFRMQGLFLQWILFLWMMNSLQLPSAKSLPRFLPLSSLALLMLSGLFLQDPSGRAVGLVGEANSFAGSAVLLGLFSYMNIREQPKQLLFICLTLVITGIIVIISGSRSGLLAYVLACLLVFLSEKKKVSVKLIINVGVLFLVASLSLPLFNQSSSWEDRAQIWHSALMAGLAHPILGNGFSNITASLRLSAERLHYPLFALYVDSSHNILLDWWVQGGLVGVGLLFFCIGYAIWIYSRKRCWFETIVLLVSMEILFFNPVSVYILAVFWWVIGRGFAKSSKLDS